jgi:predicted transcriptional regulator
MYDSTLQVLINKELKKRVQKVAFEKDETVSNLVRRLLTDYVNRNN